MLQHTKIHGKHDIHENTRHRVVSPLLGGRNTHTSNDWVGSRFLRKTHLQITGRPVGGAYQLKPVSGHWVAKLSVAFNRSRKQTQQWWSRSHPLPYQLVSSLLLHRLPFQEDYHSPGRFIPFLPKYHLLKSYSLLNYPSHTHIFELLRTPPHPSF